MNARGAAMVLAVAACGRSTATTTATATATATATTTATASASATATATALTVSPDYVDLPIDPHRNDTVVIIPVGAVSRRPILVALHGTGDRPDWTCDAWRTITQRRAWIVCPRGAHDAAWSTKDDERYAHRESIADLAAHIDLALAALAKKFPDYVDVERPVLAGFSMGAWQALRIAAREPARFTRIAIVEGGSDLAIANAKALAGAHARVLIGSGQGGNDGAAKAAAARLEAAGVPARTAFAQVGHSFDRRLQDALMPRFAWLVEGDARWESWP